VCLSNTDEYVDMGVGNCHVRSSINTDALDQEHVVFSDDLPRSRCLLFAGGVC
jgi:hypothetical protein